MHRGAREEGAMVRPTNVALVVRWRSTEEGRGPDGEEKRRRGWMGRRWCHRRGWLGVEACVRHSAATHCAREREERRRERAPLTGGPHIRNSN
jgi:hypothetical protein